MNSLVLINEINVLHRETLGPWLTTGVCLSQEDFLRLVEENHAFNCQLWATEDRARRDDKGAEFVYRAKRDIDGFNQQRNDRMEAMDVWLFTYLSPALPTDAPVHSETPGMMIDRLSILALKQYHMALQTVRPEVDEAHRAMCRQKLGIIEQQQAQLAICLQLLLEEVVQKSRTFRVYRQLKMYNDPQLNPALYSKDVN